MAKTFGSGGTPTSEIEVDRDSEAYWKGYSAGFIQDPHVCPYPQGSKQFAEWSQGYTEGTWNS